jgi:hypothetical protein
LVKPAAVSRNEIQMPAGCLAIHTLRTKKPITSRPGNFFP